MHAPSLKSTRGEYRVYGEIGAGGMASVHLGRFLGTGGFARTVAIKRPLAALQASPDFRRLAMSEALLAVRVQHPNVVSTLDVVDSEGVLLIVMEYVAGESLATLSQLAAARGKRVPLPVAVALVGGALRGLAAVHRAQDERGRSLGLIHRDISPQNILCGADGLARLADFGLAKAAGYSPLSNPDEFKGKLTYAAPEQVELKPLTAAADIYSMGVILWELFSGQRRYRDLTAPEIVARLLREDVEPPSRFAPELPPALDALVLQAMAREPERRQESALAVAAALEECVRPASVESVARWVDELGGESLRQRDAMLLDAESETAPSQRWRALATREHSLIATPLERPTAAASASGERDERPPRSSFLRAAGLRVLAMSAGVSLMWFAGERLWPRPARSPDGPSASGSATSDLPAAPAAPKLEVHPLRAEPPVPAIDSTLGDGSAGDRSAGGRSAGDRSPGAGSTSGAAPNKPARTPANTAAKARPGRTAPPAQRLAPHRDTLPDCSPPFWLDTEGIRHMKPGCK